MQRVIESIRDGTWLTRERLTGYCLLLLVAYVAQVLWIVLSGPGLLDGMGRPIGTDFANIWTSGRMVLDGRPADVFDPALQRPYQHDVLGVTADYFYGWHYPPMFLAVAAGLALLPYLAALAVWLTVTGYLYVKTMLRIVPVAPENVRLVMLAALAYPATLACITHGHNGFLTAALFGLGLLVLPSQPMQAGILFGLLAYKPQYGVLLPIALLVTRQWQAMAAAAVTVIVIVAASVLLFGVASWQSFLTNAAFTKETILENGAAGWFKLQGLFPAIRMYGGSTSFAYAAQLALVLSLLSATAWLWRSRAAHEIKSAGLILATMLATPYAFNYDTVLLGAAIAFVVADRLKHGFAAYEISALSLLWFVPLCSRELTALLNIPIAFVIQSLVLVMLLDAVRRAQTVRLSHAV